MTTLQAACPRKSSLIPGMGKSIISSPKRQDRPSVPPIVLFIRFRGLFPSKVVRAWRWLLIPSSAEIKKNKVELYIYSLIYRHVLHRDNSTFDLMCTVTAESEVSLIISLKVTAVEIRQCGCTHGSLCSCRVELRQDQAEFLCGHLSYRSNRETAQYTLDAI